MHKVVAEPTKSARVLRAEEYLVPIGESIAVEISQYE
jgi:hypothetical protein